MHESSSPLAITSTQVQKLLNLSASCLQNLVRQGKLTPLNHIKRNYRVFNFDEVKALIKVPEKQSPKNEKHHQK